MCSSASVGIRPRRGVSMGGGLCNDRLVCAREAGVGEGQ